VLRLYTAERVESLLERLAAILAEPLDDPFAPEWIAAPSKGMHQWLRQQLSERLGASAPGRRDGVVANIDLVFPGSLFGRVMQVGDDVDPWHLDRLSWAVLEALTEQRDDPILSAAGLTTRSDGATWYGRARRLADLFDHYSYGRPTLLKHWHEGRDLDPLAAELPPAQRWQPHLWRMVRTRIGQPVAAERFDQVLAELRSGALEPELPARLSLFGLTTVPGGLPFLDLLDALGQRREVHLFLLTPSLTLDQAVRNYPLGQVPTTADRTMVPRAEETTLEMLAHHPLLASWGRSSRENAVLLAVAQEQRHLSEPVAVDPPGVPPRSAASSPPTVLDRLQRDIRENRAPDGTHEAAPDDHSIRVHSCAGATRQVEVLRDAILHLLADDPTLRESDIVVLCPQLDQFAPLVEAIWGPSADRTAPSGESPPQLRYRIADRALRLSDPLIGALAALLDLLGSRFTASAVADFLALEPVRLRFGLDDEDLATFTGWIGDAGVRWGLDGSHRTDWGLPDEFSANSWRAGLDRLLMGVMLGDEQGVLGPGEVVPSPVEGSDIPRLGRLAEIIGLLDDLEHRFATPRPVHAWCELLAHTADDLLAVPWDEQWQRQRLVRVLDGVAESGFVGDRPSTATLELNDVRRLLGDLLGGEPGRISFLDGALTVTSVLPLRGLAHRVVCLLGVDQEAFTTSSVSGDDLMAKHPVIGDRDLRAETRHALLDAVLAAGSHLVITRTGRDPRTNLEVPLAVPLAELLETLTATIAGPPAFEVTHPRQAFDDLNFTTAGPAQRVWSFDRRALAGALGRSNEPPRPRPLLDRPLDAVEIRDIGLADLHGFLAHPVRAFFAQRLEVALPREAQPLEDILPAELGGLKGWEVANRLLDSRREGVSFTEWFRIERAQGALPPGSLAGREVDKHTEKVDAILAKAHELGLTLTAAPTDHHIDLVLDAGTRVAGAVRTIDTAHGPGPVKVMVSTFRPKHHLASWLDLLALTAAHPATRWRAVVVARQAQKTAERDLVVPGSDADERQAIAYRGLNELVELYRRGLREPLPLFDKSSYVVHQGKEWVGAWHGDPAFGGGDGDDAHNVLAFGNLLGSEAAALPVERHDPAGPGTDRTSRFAHLLWNLVTSTAHERPTDDEQGR